MNKSDFLTDTQCSLLVDIIDHIVPKNGELTAGGHIVIDYVESYAKTSPKTKRMLLDILALTDAMSGSLYNEKFLDIADFSKEPLLKEVEAQNSVIFGELVALVYDAYYTNEAVIKQIGPDAGIPQPKGASYQPFNPDIVENVRKLGPEYREV